MSKNNWFKTFLKENMLMALGLSTTGLVFVIISKLSNGFWYSLAYDIGSIILISGVYTVLDTCFLKNSLVNLVIEKVNLNKQINETGLIEIGNNLLDIKYKDYFVAAEKNIDILHIYGRTWTNQNIDFIKDAVLNKKCHLRIIILSPDSLFLPALEDHFGYSFGELKKYINDVTKVWKACYKPLAEKQKYFSDKVYRRSNPKNYKSKDHGTMQLYYHKGQPTNSIYRIDDKIVVVETKTSRIKSTNMSYTIYKKNKDCNNLYDIYLQELDRLIQESEKVDLDII